MFWLVSSAALQRQCGSGWQDIIQSIQVSNYTWKQARDHCRSLNASLPHRFLRSNSNQVDCITGPIETLARLLNNTLSIWTAHCPLSGLCNYLNVNSTNRGYKLRLNTTMSTTFQYIMCEKGRVYGILSPALVTNMHNSGFQ